MNDDHDDMQDEREEHPASRTRLVLVAILIVLFLMLIGLGFFIVQVVTPAGRPAGPSDMPAGLEWVRSLYGYGPQAPDMFRRPLDTAIAPDGTIWGTDPQRARVLAFEPGGSYRSLLRSAPEGSEEARTSRPDRVVIADDGTIYAVDGGRQNVLVYSPDGQKVREWYVPRPVDVAVEGDRVYVATAFGIAVCQPDGTLIATWGRRGNGPEEFDNPHGIAVGDDGTVYVSDTLNARVKAYTADGRLKWIWPKDRATAPKSGLRPSTESPSLQVPSGLCIDGTGRLVLVDAFAFQIVVLQPSDDGASLVGRYGEPGSRDGYFAYPSGISYDAARDWFAVADTNNNRVQIVRIPGSASNALTAAVMRATTGPVWLCVVPLLLLLAAVLVAVMRRRARGSDRGTGPIDGATSSEDEGV